MGLKFFTCYSENLTNLVKMFLLLRTPAFSSLLAHVSLSILDPLFSAWHLLFVNSNKRNILFTSWACKRESQHKLSDVRDFSYFLSFLLFFSFSKACAFLRHCSRPRLSAKIFATISSRKFHVFIHLCRLRSSNSITFTLSPQLKHPYNCPLGLDINPKLLLKRSLLSLWTRAVRTSSSALWLLLLKGFLKYPPITHLTIYWSST